MAVDPAWPWLGHALELVSLGLGIWCWVQAPAESRFLRVGLTTAAFYGLLLELLDLRIFGTYHYGHATWWWIGDVPLYIPVLWAIIVHSSMLLSDRSGLPVWARPFLDGLLAVLIDVAVDAIAIRLGLWRWEIPLTDGWFGVPAGNLCAWMWVAAWYSWASRLVQRRIEQRGEPSWHRWCVPPLAYVGLLCSLMAVGWAGQRIGFHTANERLWLFVLHLLGFFAMVIFAVIRTGRMAVQEKRPAPPSFMWSRWLIHLSFNLLLWMTGVWSQVPILAGIAGSALCLEGVAQWWCNRRG